MSSPTRTLPPWTHETPTRAVAIELLASLREQVRCWVDDRDAAADMLARLERVERFVRETPIYARTIPA